MIYTATLRFNKSLNKSGKSFTSECIERCIKNIGATTGFKVADIKEAEDMVIVKVEADSDAFNPYPFD